MTVSYTGVSGTARKDEDFRIGSSGRTSSEQGGETEPIHVRWLQVDWAAYNAADGTTHPAVGNLDGDGRAELVVGLGASGAGWLVAWDDEQTACTLLQWLQLGFAHRNPSTDHAWPAIGRFNQ